MNIVKDNSRGSANYGWLKTKYSFSFSEYYNPSRMGFGALRVLNDDKIDANSGFPMHPHSNMEIVTIILKGIITHQDSMGNNTEIKEGEIQRMSAGTGVFHSEYNAENEKLELFQIWIEPKIQNIKPSYEQKSFESKKNILNEVINPNGENDALSINQESYFTMGDFESNKKIEYKLKNKNNGIYLQLIEGEIKIKNEKLSQRDAIEIKDIEILRFVTLKKSKFLIMEIPLNY